MSTAPTSTTDESIDMLRRLATLGMRLAEETVERAVNSPYHPEAHHEPCQAFARVSRAVRLTIVLKARFEAGPLAFRKLGGGVRKGAASPDDDDVGDLDPLDPARETLRDHERYDETRGLPSEAFVSATEAAADTIAVVEAAPDDAADAMSAFRQNAPPVSTPGPWLQRAWPGPPKRPGSG